jgi:hypothetical protein
MTDETDKRIKEIAKNQPNFKEASPETIAKEGDLVTLGLSGLQLMVKNLKVVKVKIHKSLLEKIYF